MPFVDINGYEFLIMIVIAVVVLGPDKLPEYAARLAQLVRRLRGYAEGAKGQLREQMGPEFDDIDWKQYDVRQYDPRRIVREALLDEEPEQADPHLDVVDHGDTPGYGGSHRYDPTYTPYDIEAT